MSTPFWPCGRWSGSGQELADATESAERRQDARLARRIIVALPHELDREAQQRLVKSYCLKIRDLHGVAVAYALHPPNKKGDGRNHHAHLLLTTRRVEADKFGAKTRELDTIVSARAAVEVMREEWSKRVNAALKKAGVEVQACAENRDWLSQATKALTQHWHRKNSRKRTAQSDHPTLELEDES